MRAAVLPFFVLSTVSPPERILLFFSFLRCSTLFFSVILLFADAGGSYSVIPRVPGGELTPDQLICMGQVTLTNRTCIWTL